MLLTLLTHQFKQFWRAQNLKLNLFLQIISLLGVLYLLFLVVMFGIYLDEFIEEMRPGQDVIAVFCSITLYYFALDILLRFMFQGLPSIFIQPYLVQNIKRRTIVNYLHLRTALSMFNLLPLVFFVPFAWFRVAPVYGYAASAGFTLMLVSLVAFNNFFIAFIKRKTSVNPVWLAGFMVVVALLVLSEYLHYISIGAYAMPLFTALFRFPLISLGMVALAAVAFFNEHTFLLRHFYLEEAGPKQERKIVREYTWLTRFGYTGELLASEFKLMFRNKRTKGAYFGSLIFLFYGFLFYRADDIVNGNLAKVLFASIFITSAYMVQATYMVYAAQSAFFDGLMSSNMKIRDYVTGKYFFLVITSLPHLILSFGYAYLSWKVIPIAIAGYFFNIGITAFLSLYFGTRYYKAVEIEKAATFNQRGFSIEQFIFPLLAAFICICLYAPFAVLTNAWVAVAAVGVAGFISFLCHRFWLKNIAEEFALKKYKLLEGFRDK